MTWEERMAAKAAGRQKVLADKAAEESRKYWDWQNELWVQEYADSLTVEQAIMEQVAIEKNPVGCACTGGKRCCIIRAEARKRVLK